MKTITNCFFWIALCIVWASLNLLAAVSSIYHQEWGVFALNIISMLLCVWGVISAYKRAKSYEETILEAIDNALDIAVLAHNKALRLESKEILSELEKLRKDKKDEVEEDNGTTE